MKPLDGVYLVIDPKQEWNSLLDKLHSALRGGINIVQIWNHWQPDLQQHSKLQFVKEVKALAGQFGVPVLMHDDWELAQDADLEGVHFDQVPDRFDLIKDALATRHIGLTVGNDLNLIAWAEEQSLSYISFCAVFPSPSVSSCEIVDQENIRKARKITRLPIFLSGGIRPENLVRLKHLSFDGIAIISGVLSAESPEEAVKQYLEKLKEFEIAL